MSTESLNVIALISGGKDSLYSILHCLRNGHRVVALANLRPPPPASSSGSAEDDSNGENDGEAKGEEDMNSFMYQTIGHNIIPLYESALDIPLYRGDIIGGAVDTSRIYRDQPEEERESEGAIGQEDETESLIPLLNLIKQDIPHANAVSAGAILSTYQRTRIENVAGRLGLVPLAFLWMYPFLPPSSDSSALSLSTGVGGLLEDMAAVGCDARIIKVASGGLDDDILWENVSSSKTQRRLHKVMRPYVDDAQTLKGAVLGEGGEYETLALDGPGLLWKKKIVVDERDRVLCRVDSGVSHVRILKARCVEKDDSLTTKMTPEDVRRPAQFDERFRQVLMSLQEQEFVSASEEISRLPPSPESIPIDIFSTSIGTLDTISNITAPEAGSTADVQMRAISNKLQSLLHSTATTDDIVFTTILLRSMADFAPMNAVYISLFTKPNPPARVTVACGDRLPEGVQVMVSAVIDLGPREKREGLHVQSRSYWAPANIGPYSQAITVPYAPQHEPTDRNTKGGLVYIAGQIPLDPPSMVIPGGINSTTTEWFQNFTSHAVLSLQHLWRIGLATKVDWWIGAIVFLARGDSHHPHRGRQKARIANRMWQAMHSRDTAAEVEEDADIDIWDIKHGLIEDPRMSQGGGPALPNWEVVVDNSDEKDIHPPCFAVEVEQLPRDSDIEWQALGTTGLSINAPVRILCTTAPDTRIWHTKLADRNGSFYTIEISETQSTDLGERIDAALSSIGFNNDGKQAHCTIYTPSGQRVSQWRGQVVPCYNVWGSDGTRLSAAITAQSAW